MIGQQAVSLIDRLLVQAKQPTLNDLQSTIVLETWEGNTYKSVADRLSYDLDYIKQIAARLWKLLSKLLNENICKSNIKSVLERYQKSIRLARPLPWKIIEGKDVSASTEIELQFLETWMISDRITTIAFFNSRETNNTPQLIKLDFLQRRLRQQQVRNEIRSLISQGLHELVTPNVLINEILSILTIENSGEIAIDCLIINCYA
jgi:hypothetical protein